jgi:hypothetical protein
VCRAKGKGQRAEGRGQRAEDRGQKSTEICGRPQADPFGIGARQEEGLGSKKKKKCDLVGLGLGLRMGLGHWDTGGGSGRKKIRFWFDVSKDRRRLRHWRSETAKGSWPGLGPARQRGTKPEPQP